MDLLIVLPPLTLGLAIAIRLGSAQACAGRPPRPMVRMASLATAMANAHSLEIAAARCLNVLYEFSLCDENRRDKIRDALSCLFRDRTPSAKHSISLELENFCE